MPKSLADTASVVDTASELRIKDPDTAFNTGSSAELSKAWQDTQQDPADPVQDPADPVDNVVKLPSKGQPSTGGQINPAAMPTNVPVGTLDPGTGTSVYPGADDPGADPGDTPADPGTGTGEEPTPSRQPPPPDDTKTEDLPPLPPPDPTKEQQELVDVQSTDDSNGLLWGALGILGVFGGLYVASKKGWI